MTQKLRTIGPITAFNNEQNPILQSQLYKRSPKDNFSISVRPCNKITIYYLILSVFSHSLFAGVLGAIDGTHIAINAPEDNQKDYLNRKMSQSVILQAVCNSRGLFTDCFAGMYKTIIHFMHCVFTWAILLFSSGILLLLTTLI